MHASMQYEALLHPRLPSLCHPVHLPSTADQPTIMAIQTPASATVLATTTSVQPTTDYNTKPLLNHHLPLLDQTHQEENQLSTNSAQRSASVSTYSTDTVQSAPTPISESNLTMWNTQAGILANVMSDSPVSMLGIKVSHNLYA
jgi:hypothetical protein